MGKIVHISPDERKKCDLIITTACRLNEIDKKAFIADTDRSILGIRQQVFYLIKINTDLNPEKIAHLFDMSRQRICYGIEQAEMQRGIYPNVLRSMRKIVEKANEETENEYELTY